jgi:CRP-like cAMP-binding protein
MSNDESCLVSKLSNYIDLDDTDLDLLARLEGEEKAFAPQQTIHRSGEPTKNLYVIKQGWLFSDLELPDGRRQIVQINHAGDIIGMPDIALESAALNVQSITDTVLCPFPKKHLDAIFTTSPRLIALLFTISLRDQAIFTDKLRAIGRMSARERVAWFLLDIAHRLRMTNRSMTDTFRMPMTQTEIGDATALTSVTISKTMMQLQLDKLIDRREGKITLREPDALMEMCNYVSRYKDMDTSWFPARDAV